MLGKLQEEGNFWWDMLKVSTVQISEPLQPSDKMQLVAIHLGCSVTPGKMKYFLGLMVRYEEPRDQKRNTVCH